MSTTSPQRGRNYDISPDGSFIISALPAGATEATSTRAQRIEIVTNWFEELKRLVPTN
jgi:hypothetical protein